jgi:hypothetical protein
MTSSTNTLIPNSIKAKPAKPKLRNNKRNTRSKPLLSHVIGICANSDGELELVSAGGLVDFGGEFWTTQRLADELFHHLARKEAKPELVSIPYASKDNCTKNVDLLESYESHDTLLYRKYIIRAEKLAGVYSKDKPIIFVVNLADLTERLQAELIDLMTANSKRTLSYVLYLAVARVFALASLAWFYDSAREEIQVTLEP